MTTDPRDLGAMLASTRSHLARWPYFYVMLRTFLPNPTKRPMSDRITLSMAVSRTPENVPAMNVLDSLSQTATTWAAYAAALGHTSLPPAARHGREGTRLVNCLAYLHRHGDRLLSITLSEEYEEALVLGTHAARRVLHEDQLVHRLPAPCPHCQRVALIRHNGEDHVYCGACRTAWSSRQYELLCKVLAAEVNGATVHG